MELFPLYSELKMDVARNPPTLDWRKWSSIIATLNEDQLETIYTLILSGGTITDKAPFGGRTFDGGRGIVFHINNIPIEIQQIVTRYLEWISQKEEA